MASIHTLDEKDIAEFLNGNISDTEDFDEGDGVSFGNLIYLLLQILNAIEESTFLFI